MLTDRLIALCWAAFCGYWALGSFRARASNGAPLWLSVYRSVRFVVPAGFLVYVALFVVLPQHDSPPVAVRVLGASLCAVGIAMAIWARTYLGASWGMPMTKRDVPHLVTSGPYAYVRHPIYTGVLLGIMGTMVAAHPKALVGWPLIAFAFFGISVFKEERDLLKVFPEQYRAYMSRTKRLIPFVW